MARKAQSKRKAAEREAIQAARIGGRYAIVAALIAAVVGAVVTAALTNLFGLLASPSDRAGQLGGSPAKGAPVAVVSVCPFTGCCELVSADGGQWR